MDTIDTTQDFTIRTRMLGWKEGIAGVFCVLLGGAVVPVTLQEKGPWGMVALGVGLALLGLGCLWAVWRSRSRPSRDILTLGPGGLRLWLGYDGLVHWPDVLGVGHITINAGYVRVRQLKISLAPGVTDRLEQNRITRMSRKLDRAVGVDGLMIAESLMSIPLAQAAALVETYRTAHAGPWATTD